MRYGYWRDSLPIALGVALTATAAADEPNGFEALEDDDLRPNVHGRIYLEGAFFREDITPLGSQVDIPDARLAVYGKAGRDWRYFAQYDLADNSPVKDAWLRYQGLAAELKIGQFQAPFSLEEMTSSRYTTFMERGLPNVFSPGYSMGVSLHFRHDYGTVTGGLFGERAGTDPDDEGNMGFGLTGRATLAPYHRDRRVFHLGASATARQPNDDQEIEYETEPETDLTDVEFVDTGDLEDVSEHAVIGLETALVVGSWSVQGEYMQTADVVAGERRSFDGSYAFVSWFPTGETRPYDATEGEFDRVRPQGPGGALELALRYSELNLNDGPIQGGRQQDLTLGVNWYFNPYLRLMVNYIRVNADGPEGKESPSLVSTRLQFDF